MTTLTHDNQLTSTIDEGRSRLCLHMGEQLADRETVRNVEVPERTDTFVPVSHRFVLDNVIDRLSQRNLHVAEEAHALWKDGLRWVGLLGLEGGNGHMDVVAVVNANDRSSSLKLFAGHQVTACANLSIWGQGVAVRVTHRSRIFERMPSAFERAVDRLQVQKIDNEHRIAAYQNQQCGNGHAHDMLCDMVHKDLLPPTRLRGILNHWHRPDGVGGHEEFLPRNLWTFWNAITQTERDGVEQGGRSLLQSLPNKHISMTAYLDRVVGFEPDPRLIEPATVN